MEGDNDLEDTGPLTLCQGWLPPVDAKDNRKCFEVHATYTSIACPVYNTRSFSVHLASSRKCAATHTLSCSPRELPVSKILLQDVGEGETWWRGEVRLSRGEHTRFTALCQFLARCLSRRGVVIVVVVVVMGGCTSKDTTSNDEYVFFKYLGRAVCKNDYF